MKLRKIIFQLGAILSVIILFSASGHAADKFNIMIGEWQRADGNYLIKVSDILADGQAKAEYFNPSPIRVAKAAVSTQKGFIKLFIKFQDKGYEGSTYTLYYYADKDSLVGYYYQAAMKRTYEVYFNRKAS